MSSFRILGDEVFSLAEFTERVETVEESPVEDRDAILKAHPLETEFTSTPETDSSPVPFKPIGQGKPLTVLIRHVYTGKHPKSLIGGGKDMAVVTGLKDYAAFAASSRALNFMERGIKPHKDFVAPSTFNGGTNVVAYSPAVLTDSLHFTVEIAFDQFPKELADKVASGLTSLAGIPMLIPAAGYLLAASSLLKIGADWADAMIDGRAAFSVTDTLDFNLPGVVPPVADFRVLCRPGFDPSGLRFRPGRGLTTSDDRPYDGDEPYVVISLDGAERQNLEKFSPTLATAEVLKQFFNMRDGGEASVDAILGAFRVANDMKYRDQAKDLAADVMAEKDDVKKKALEAKLEAVKKNIVTSELKLP